jgi:recombination protein RecT
MSAADLKAVATGKPAEGKNPVVAFSNFLDRFKPQMALALPKHLNADRLARLAVTAFSTTPKLQQCSPDSIIASIMTAAVLGLEPNVNGQCFLVPYGTTCTLVPGWKGLCDLAQRSGRCSVWTGCVHEGDVFEYALGDSPFIRHVPGDEDDDSRITHVYSVGRINGSEWPVIEVWSVGKVKKHRDRYNKVGAKHYSFRDWEMYARKIPLLQVLKYMPQSIELANAIAINDAHEMGNNATLDRSQFVTDLGPMKDEDAKPEARQVPQDSEDPAAGVQTGTTKPAAKSEAGVTYDKVFAQIQKAKSLDTLDIAADLIKEVFDENDQVKLSQLVIDRREELSS